MKHETKAVLERAAMKSGGDRYSVQPKEKNGEPWVIYVPQSISREGQSPAPILTIVIQPEF